MVRSRSLLVALLMILMAPASAQLANEPPDYFVDVHFEETAWHEADDGTGTGTKIPVAGPMAYHYDDPTQEGILVTWTNNGDPLVPDHINFFLEDDMEDTGFKFLKEVQLPAAWWGHDFHRQWILMNWDYVVLAGWSPTLNTHSVLVYTHVAGATHDWYLTCDLSDQCYGGPASSLLLTTTIGPIDDITLFGDHIAVANDGLVQVFWDNCQFAKQELDGVQDQTPLAPPGPLPPPLPPVPYVSDTAGFTKGRCWAEENFFIELTEGSPAPSEVLLPTTATYTQPGNAAVRFWANGGELYLVAMDPLAANGEDPSNSLRDLPKGHFELWKHDPDIHQWLLAPLPENVEARMPHDDSCVRGAGWGGCYHYQASITGGAGLAPVGDYLMVTETKHDGLIDWQMAHFYRFNETGILVHMDFVNITMLFQGTFGHVAWSDGDAEAGEVLMHVKDFYQQPFTKQPFYLEEFHRRGSIHHISFTFEDEEDGIAAELASPLESAQQRHLTTCSATDSLGRTGNLFHAVRTEPTKSDIWIGYAYEDRVPLPDDQWYRDNRDPTVPHPFLNDIPSLHNFKTAGDSTCDLGYCMNPDDDCGLPPDEPTPPDNRDRGTVEDLDNRNPRNSDAPDGSGDGSGDGDGAASNPGPRPKAQYPIDEDGDNVPENEVEGFEVDNCPGEYNPVGANGQQPACTEIVSSGSGGGTGNGDNEPLDSGSLRPESKLPAQAWVAMAIGLLLVLLVFLVARRRNDDDA